MNALDVSRRLYKALTSLFSFLPQFTGQAWSLEKGIAYHVPLSRRNRRRPEDEWFWKLPHLDTKMVYGRVYAAVHWPNLLAQAELSAKPLGSLAHSLLEFLLPIIDQYDSVFATDLRFIRKNYAAVDDAERADRPMWLGQDGPETHERFNRHLDVLVHNESFVSAVRRTMEATYRTMIHSPWRVGVPRGTTDAVLLKQTTFLQTRYLREGAGIRTEFIHPVVYPSPPDLWIAEIRRLTEGFTGTDGCWRVPRRGTYGDAVLVNWATVFALAKHQGRETPFEHLRMQGEGDEVRLGISVRRYFDEKNGGVFFAPRPIPMYQLVETVAKSYMHDTLEQPWELYKLKALTDRLKVFQSRSSSAHEINLSRSRTVSPRKPPKYRILEYQYEGHTVRVTRRDHRSLFTLPYQLTGEYDQSKVRAKRCYKIAGYDFWDERGLNLHTNGYSGSSPALPPIEGADAFRKWAEILAVKLMGRGFGKALYSQKLGHRIGDKLAGRIDHLSAFAEAEDIEIQKYCESHPGGEWTDEAKKEIASLLPCRSFNAIIRRKELLGYKYAREHGWKKYTESGYCTRVTLARRRKWSKLGVG